MSTRFDVDNDLNHLTSSPIKVKNAQPINSNTKSLQSAKDSKLDFEDAEEMESEEDPDYDAYFGNLLYTKH